MTVVGFEEEEEDAVGVRVVRLRCVVEVPASQHRSLAPSRQQQQKREYCLFVMVTHHGNGSGSLTVAAEHATSQNQ